MAGPKKVLDAVYNKSGIDLAAIGKKYGKRVLIGAGAIGAGAAVLPKDEKKLISDSAIRSRDRYPEYDSLEETEARTQIPEIVGLAGGAALGAFAAKKGLSKAVVKGKIMENATAAKAIKNFEAKRAEQAAAKAAGRAAKGLPPKIKKEKEPGLHEMLLKPIMEKATKRFGESSPKMVAGGLAGAAIGSQAVALPFDAQQAHRDYKSGLKRYDGNKFRAGVSAIPFPVPGVSMYAAEKLGPRKKAQTEESL